METNSRGNYAVRPVSRLYITGLCVMLVLFAGISCYYSISYQTRSLLMHWDNTLNELYEAYSEKVYSFSSVYEPVFLQDSDRDVFMAYFSRKEDQTPDVIQFSELYTALSLMLSQDNDIDWIALVAPEAKKNYFLVRGRSQLSVLPESFPFQTDESGNGKLKLLGARKWTDQQKVTHFSYCISGGAIPAGTSGNIMVGYNTESLKRVLQRSTGADSARFLVLAGDQTVYDSAGEAYDSINDFAWVKENARVHQDPEGRAWYATKLHNDGRGFSCVYMATWDVTLQAAGGDIGLLLGLLLGFTAMSMILYAVSSRRIFRRVDTIREGLITIGRNDLSYRLPVSEHGDEFDGISENINIMTGMLQQAMDREYEMRLKHMQLQLTQIQARFNPHFLYNTLEMIRSKLFDRGDMESADYIERLARIFRNLTDAKAVVQLRDEISFCSLYVSLLQLRYSGDISVSYDVDPELLSCGVIANLIQPAIENYFVHAVDEAREANELEIICEAAGENEIRMVIADNGQGASEKRMAQVNQQLRVPELKSPNYGLMSIAKRIKLFYGDGYGVHLEANKPQGMRVVIRIPKMSMEEHEAKLMPSK